MSSAERPGSPSTPRPTLPSIPRAARLPVALAKLSLHQHQFGRRNSYTDTTWVTSLSSHITTHDMSAHATRVITAVGPVSVWRMLKCVLKIRQDESLRLSSTSVQRFGL